MKKNKTLVFILLFLLSVFLGGFYFYFNPNILYFLRGEKDFSKLIIEIDFYIDKKNLMMLKKQYDFHHIMLILNLNGYLLLKEPRFGL